MKNPETLAAIPLWKTLGVLIVFPIVATLISLMLLDRSLFASVGIDFFNAFWTIIICWYLLQIFIVSKILKSSGWHWSNIGFAPNKKEIIYLIAGYIIFAFGLFAFIEYTLAHAVIDPGKLQSISSLTPKTTTARLIFILMGLVAGLAEEIVYRGFAITSLQNHKINKWLTIPIAAIPFVFQHGLKSIDQFWWFLIWGLAFGILFVSTKKLFINIIIHWLVILSAMLGILQALK